MNSEERLAAIQAIRQSAKLRSKKGASDVELAKFGSNLSMDSAPPSQEASVEITKEQVARQSGIEFEESADIEDYSDDDNGQEAAPNRRLSIIEVRLPAGSQGAAARAQAPKPSQRRRRLELLLNGHALAPDMTIMQGIQAFGTSSSTIPHAVLPPGLAGLGLGDFPAPRNFYTLQFAAIMKWSFHGLTSHRYRLFRRQPVDPAADQAPSQASHTSPMEQLLFPESLSVKVDGEVRTLLGLLNAIITLDQHSELFVDVCILPHLSSN